MGNDTQADQQRHQDSEADGDDRCDGRNGSRGAPAASRLRGGVPDPNLGGARTMDQDDAADDENLGREAAADSWSLSPARRARLVQ